MRRPRLLMGAYACAPNAASEPGAGWAWAVAASSAWDVTLLTRENNRTPLEREIASRSLQIKPVYFDLSQPWLRAKRKYKFHRAYYVRWQLAANEVARRLHSLNPFDAAHHVTFAADWGPSAVIWSTGPPAVWGPVGGSVRTPMAMSAWLGPVGFFQELCATLGGIAARQIWGASAARHAALRVAQNSATAAIVSRYGRTVVEQNIVVDSQLVEDVISARIQASEPYVVFVGRLVPVKAPRLALAAFAEAEVPNLHIYFVGAGRELRALRRVSQKRGLEQRVHFLGERTRTETLTLMGEARGLIFPSMHDAAGWAVAEASTLGVPVVCLDWAGPADVVKASEGFKVSPGFRAKEEMAKAIRSIARRQLAVAPTERWLDGNLPARLDRLYSFAFE